MFEYKINNDESLNGEHMENISIRRLTDLDYLSYKNIRLELLKAEPANFGSSFKEESMFTKQRWIERLSKTYVYSLGAFDGKRIVGILILALNPRKKLRHVAKIHSMYVKPDYRNKNIAKTLISHAFSFAKQNGVEIIRLEVVSSNIFAYNLYQSVGFKSYGIEKNAMKLEQDYFDFNLMSKDLE